MDVGISGSRGAVRPSTAPDGDSGPAPLDAASPICRICRGEGTAAEPLFYPCKCSGSIKFVHQDCLMEWLSHSQKKYCELCKTSFRFTKLYSPDMPTTLPWRVFVQHMSKHLFWNMVTWLRAILTISIWVGWLPYFMRGVWSFMFWSASLALKIGKAPICLANPLVPETCTRVQDVERAMSVLSGQNFPPHFVNLLLGSISRPASAGTLQSSSGWYSMTGMDADDGVGSVLSDVRFLRNLTRSPALNRLIISIIEGQIITILVIICFILVILVRDYVIQQQPEINGRAAAAAEAEPQNDAEQLPEFDNGLAQDPLQHFANPVPAAHQDVEERPASANVGEFADDFPQLDMALMTAQTNDERRVLRWNDGHETLDEYMEIWNRADRNPQRVLDLIYAEGDEERLAPWVEITRFMLGAPQLESDIRTASAPNVDVNAADELFPHDEAVETHETEQQLNDYEQPDTSALQTTSTHFEAQERPSYLANRPGSEFQSLYQQPEATSQVDSRDTTDHRWMRPRAASDGPTGQSSINPLASNSWSFADLPDEPNNGFDPPTQLNNAGTERSYPVQTALQRDPSASSSISHVYASGLPELDSPASELETHNEKSNNSLLTSANDPAIPTDAATSLNGPSNFDFAAPLDIPGDLELEPETSDDLASPIEELPDGRQNPEANGILETIADFMWGDATEADDFNAEAMQAMVAELDEPWEDLPIAGGEGDVANAADEQEAAQDGVADAFDQDAIDEMEDFEGVMELIGMRGPIAGLFQNAVFCAVLVSVSIFACIFVPYNVGRVALWTVANPARVIRVLIEISKVIQDTVIACFALSSWVGVNLVELAFLLVRFAMPNNLVAVRKSLWALWRSAAVRVASSAFFDVPTSATEIQNFSAISHEALFTVRAMIKSNISGFLNALGTVYSEYIRHPGLHTITAVPVLVKRAFETCVWLAKWPLTPELWLADLRETDNHALLNPELTNWSAGDRFWAIAAGYLALFALGAMYLNREANAARNARGWEAGIIDSLTQASGIMKVILVISIEMLLFPLYCGILLDVALLPLFGGATLGSRAAFAMNYPLTSAFVHWFVGTGYMFHFALFVSMCRKIMRPGVLYFIRDPDDPEFHPVREVLEKKLTTQLRKILYSAFIYGALVIICLGGVVWSLHLALPAVLPIHYSSNEPVLEFPVDLLFYNFLMPLAVKFFKPSDAIHVMYTWCFRKCARYLRLTYFIFGERKIDEEGVLHLSEDSEHQQTLYTRFFLELDERNQVVPKTWSDLFERYDSKPNPPLSKTERKTLKLRKAHLVNTGQLVKDGYFVRAPASDRIKIAKGLKIFLPVSESNKRKDEVAEEDMYESDQFQFVYIPPNFRTRIFSFILFIWLFAAVTGVSFTVMPLVLGRVVFKMVIPDHVRTNDIYAFSIGIYILGSITYLGLRFTDVVNKLQGWLQAARDEMMGDGALGRCARKIQYGAGLVYTYFFLLVVFPLVMSMFLEAYVLLPVNTYLNPPTEQILQASSGAGNQNGQHSIHITQAWVLGLLHLKLATTLVTSLFPGTRFAVAVRRVMRRGWLEPDVSLFSRAFVLGGILLSIVALVVPPLAANVLMKWNAFGLGHPVGMSQIEAQIHSIIVHRYSYPTAAMLAVALKYALSLTRVVDGWTLGIRDEAYLIGERLHNFGAATAGAKKGAGAWKASGQRLG
ncbi:hypothetical protein VHEMI02504 [[Torrubiella] hemipterigena]|uniref:RING-type E3 ubiquitin transferase n=1 Tax=[Torrubiella] hemipterigena TaxID=1531966 RepID=A0A0A1T832_9HYPO|nr:hypothetical protein VHEMI02504 [[Torrubiella] hemipterigena]